MGNNILNESSEISKPRFGQIAVEYGLVTRRQVKSALKEQLDDKLANRQNRLLGLIFFENGWMTLGEVEKVLNELIRRNKEYKEINYS